ncbi:hypothetical protein GS429_07780 [Natronorubrum sp. JWXQ-INN-674]|uniref:Uncharacterized protein n=1 Tax=Natronorubrum halalkaliphilum TaxID=2691917 RepID=A0A6B0VLF0_9EURY|nr:hypothetical protein [Natronorubrum halalkaliphilum]MXV61957.1 hypothetical protein [Natronorubrum halalkaliphilum]
MSRSPTRSFHGERSNAYLSWTAVVVALLIGGWAVFDGRFHELVFATSLAAIVLLPAIALESERAALPWEISMLALLPLFGAVVVSDPLARQLTLYAGASVLALALTLEVHALTEIRLERFLAAAFVTMLSAGIAAVWATLTWFQDLVAGTSIIASNDEVMLLLIAATAAGPVAGTVFDRYYRQFPGEELVSAPVDGVEEELFAAKTGADDHPTLEERIPISSGAQRGLLWAMRGALVAMVGYGIVAPDSDTISNAGSMLVVSVLPVGLRRRYDLPFDTGFVLWITLVAFLHALGSVYFYEHTFWWHNLTHPLSATLVGAIGYVVIRSLDELREEIHVPPSLVPSFVVLFVLSLGVFWEIGEFTFDLLAERFSLSMPLSQHGLADTMSDIVFNTVGAIVVAVWGLPYLAPVTDAITDRLATVSESRNLPGDW